MVQWLYPKPGMCTPSHAHKAQPEPFVFDDGKTKSLYFSLDQLQSRMDKAQPHRLEVDYTKTMMGFMLWCPAPRRLALIGLGGGSLVKFCHQHLPQTHVTAVEINPSVIALRDQFLIPPDGERLTVLQADGADYVQHCGNGLDVLMVDGFDHAGQPGQLCSPSFYSDCYRALTPRGVLVVNLHHDDPEHATYLLRIRQNFGAAVFEFASQEKSNSVVFAGKDRSLDIGQLRRRDTSQWHPELMRQLKPEFDRLTWAAH